MNKYQKIGIVGIVVVFLLILFVSEVFFKNEFADRIIDSSDQLTQSEDKGTIAFVVSEHLNKDGSIPDALQDRLDTAKDLYLDGSVSGIIVANFGEAADIMGRDLVINGVDVNYIFVDDTATSVKESCNPDTRPLLVEANIVFVAQASLLKQTLSECDAQGVVGQGYIVK